MDREAFDLDRRVLPHRENATIYFKKLRVWIERFTICCASGAQRIEKLTLCRTNDARRIENSPRRSRRSEFGV
jgi:hypothetical protein